MPHLFALRQEAESGAAQTAQTTTQKKRGPRGVGTRQPENSKLAHLRVPALQTPPKFHETTPREEERMKIVAGEGKKREILGLPPFGAPSFKDPSGPQPSGLPLLRSLPPFGPTLRGPSAGPPPLRLTAQNFAPFFPLPPPFSFFFSLSL